MTEQPRRGFALVTVLVVMVLAIALMMAAQYRASAEAVAARYASLRRRAFVASEAELLNAVAAAASVRNNPIGASTTRNVTRSSVSVLVVTTRVSDDHVWITSAATATDGVLSARHRLGVSLTIDARHPTSTPLPLAERAWVELF